jgi:predicted RNA-binding protein with PUA-like domain
MDFFLVKTEPKAYSIKDFAKEKVTNWDGVHNRQAILVIKSWKIGDMVLVYHSGGESRIVGLAKVISLPKLDENDERGFSWCADLEFIREFSENKNLSLKSIKISNLFSEFALVKQSRLSVMKCPQNFVNWIEGIGLDLSSKK